MRLELANDSDILRIFEFEHENADFFRRIGFSRNPLYYQYNTFNELIREAFQNQKRDKIYMYLVLNDKGEIIGRVNFNHIDRLNRNLARVKIFFGEKGFKQNLGTTVLRQAIQLAKEQNHFDRLEAMTESTNIGCQVALIKSGFTFAGKFSNCKRKGSDFIDVIIFEYNL